MPGERITPKSLRHGRGESPELPPDEETGKLTYSPSSYIADIMAGKRVFPLPDTAFGEKKDGLVFNSEEDIIRHFKCDPSQIAHNPSGIRPDTVAYIGPICETIKDPKTGEDLIAPEYKGIFYKLEHVECIYTSLPEGRIEKIKAAIGGITKEQIKKELYAKKINFNDELDSLINSHDFTTLEHQEKVDLIRLTVKDLGFPNGATTDQIYKRALELGLELCPAETGPNLKLQNSSPDLMFIAMEPIAVHDDDPRVWGLHHPDVGGLVALRRLG